MLDLTCIFLHNWHRFKSVLIPVQDSLYLAGHNGSGKSTILDAMQVVLLADLDLIKFNSSAQERSERTLDGFVRGKIFETKLLRPGDCVGYIALEFTDSRTGKQITLGCCIEAGEKFGKNGERAYFILQEGLDRNLFVPGERPLTRSELKKALQKRGNKCRYYDTVREYQEDMLDGLGGLNRRFFDLFQRALSFKTIKDIGGFVEQWLLPENPLDLQDLQKVVTRLEDLHKEAKIVETKLDELGKIVTKRTNYLRQKALQAQYEVLHVLLSKEAAVREREALEQQAEQIQERLKEQEANLQQLDAALTGARQAKQEVERRLYGLDVVRRRDELTREIERRTREAEEMSRRKRELLRELQKVSNALLSLKATALLEIQEEQAVQALLGIITKPVGADLSSPTADLSASLIEELAPQVEDAMTALNLALKRAQQRTFVLEEQSKQLRSRAGEREQEIRALKTQGTSASYPKNVEFLRTALEKLIGRRPDILCELLEIPDERWQTAVEAMLGERRFSIIVPPASYETILAFIERNKAEKGLHDAAILDLERAYKERRSPLPNSLAFQVTTKNKDAYLRAYIDFVLGKIITCSSARDLRRYKRAITPDLVYYSEWAVRVLSPQRYQPWVVGQRAQRSQIEARERELKEIATQLAQLNETYTQARSEEQQLNLGTTLARLLPRLDSPLDDTALRAEIASLTAERDSLDLSIVNELQAEIARLEQIIREEERQARELSERLGELKDRRVQVEREKRLAADRLLEREQSYDEVVSRHAPEVLTEAERLFAEQSRESDLTQAIANADRTAKNFTTQSNNTFSDYQELGIKYNLRYQFAGLSAIPQDTRYVEERDRLAETDLPNYMSQIEQTRQEAIQELREHVLHILRERISYAQRELQRMNDALKPLDFHGDQYRFCWEIAREMKEYYHLIMDSQVIGTGPLFESEFYQMHKDTFDRFYTEVTRTSVSDAEKALRARLIDYRTYLEYDIEVRHSDGRTSRLSRIMGQTSGGETQTPFYLAVAASFVQLYRMGVGEQRKTRNERPAIRLAVFDEAFTKMDQNRIGTTLDMFLKYGLQVVTATPLERCEYLVPKMCTNLVLTTVGENVLIEEYRNYEARLTEKLEEMYAVETDPSLRSG
jgi:uncharacterized protein YPO0396